jgi:hypothetical protein
MLTFKQQNYSSYQPAINAILKDDITGIVVENSINKEILDILKNSLTSLKQQFFTDLNDNNGFSLPGMFGQLHKTQPFAEVDNYFQNIKPFCAAVDIAAGFCVQDWIRQQLTVFLILSELPNCRVFCPIVLGWFFQTEVDCSCIKTGNYSLLYMTLSAKKSSF